MTESATDKSGLAVEVYDRQHSFLDGIGYGVEPLAAGGRRNDGFSDFHIGLRWGRSGKLRQPAPSTIRSTVRKAAAFLPNG